MSAKKAVKKAAPAKKRAIPAAVKKRVARKSKVVSTRTTTKKKPSKTSTTASPKRFAGLKLCFAGKPGWYGQDRKAYETWAKSDGAKIVTKLDDSTDMLVVLDSGATAAAKKKAAALNAKSAAIHELSESDFLEMFRPTADEVVDLLKAGKKGSTRLKTLIKQSNLEHYQHRRSVDLSGVDLRGSDLSQLSLNWAILDGADLRKVTIDATEIAEAKNLRLENASGGHLRFDSMSDCQCKNASIHNIFAGWHSYGTQRVIENCDFTNANLDNAYINYGAVKSTSFKKAILSDADIKDSKLTDVDFTQADFTKADLSSSSCKGCVFTKAKFANANLQGFDFGNSDLSGADFSNSVLVGADFSKALLGNAKFDGAVVAGANFDGTDTSKTRGLTLLAGKNSKAGKACREVAAAAKNAQEISIEALIVTPEGKVKSQIGVAYGHIRFSFSLTLADQSITKDSISYWSQMTSVAKSFERLGELWGHGEIDFGQLKVSSTKSDIKGKALKEMVTSALSEVFDIAPPSEEDIKNQQKSAKQAKADLKKEMADEIRGGKVGIKKFNGRKTDDYDYTEYDLRKEDFSGQTLTGLKASHANFQASNFKKARIRKASLECCKLQKCNFKEADLVGTSLTWCSMTDADLSGASLSKCNFSDATLDRVNFSGADLTAAKLTDGSILGANFSDATLKDAKWKGCAFDEKTVFPDGFTVPEEMQFKGKGYDPRHVVDQAALSQVLDFDTFMERIRGTVDQSRLAKSLKMLKADRFELFSEVSDDSFTGVVKSQSDADLVYSCRLTSDGEFACCTQNLNPCGGLRGALCKHLLVLIVGLTKGNQIDPQKAATWADASNACKPELDKDIMSEVLLKYKGAEAGEVDWRPVETIPEDYYAF